MFTYGFDLSIGLGLWNFFKGVSYFNPGVGLDVKDVGNGVGIGKMGYLISLRGLCVEEAS